jgi:hypothetical protein
MPDMRARLFNLRNCAGSAQTVGAAAIALLPIGADWIYKVFLSPRPFWAFYYDPETIHFYGSLRLLAGERPLNTDNPGTPLQMLGAVISLLTGRSPLDFESFRFTGYLVGIGLISLSVFFLVRTFTRNQPFVFKFSLLWMFYIAPASLLYLTIWSPELLYLPCGALALILGWQNFSRPGSVIRSGVFGAAVGLCIAVKFTFLAWVPAVFLSSAVRSKGEPHPLRKRILPSMAGIVVGFVSATLPIISTYPSRLRWLISVPTHSGPFGQGGNSLPSGWELLTNTYRLVVPSLDWHLCVLALMLAVAAVIVRRGKSLDPAILAMAVFAIVAHISTFILALAARHVSPRYLLPGGLTGLVLLTVALTTAPQKRVRDLTFAVPVILGVLIVLHVFKDIRINDRLINDQMMLRSKIEASLYRHDNAWPEHTVIFGWRVPEPSFALRIMTENRDDQNLISDKYPREGYIDWGGKVQLPVASSRWDYAVLKSENISSLVPYTGRVIDRANEYSIIEATDRR